MKKYIFCTVLSVLGFLAFGQSEIGKEKYGYKKVSLQYIQEVKALEKKGVGILVRAKDYLLLKVPEALLPLTFPSSSPQEADFIRRVVRVEFAPEKKSAVLAEYLDIWEVGATYVVGRTFDLHIQKLKSLGYNPVLLAQ